MSEFFSKVSEIFPKKSEIILEISHVSSLPYWLGILLLERNITTTAQF
jgi:hypothetical protein